MKGPTGRSRLWLMLRRAGAYIGRVVAFIRYACLEPIYQLFHRPLDSLRFELRDFAISFSESLFSLSRWFRRLLAAAAGRLSWLFPKVRPARAADAVQLFEFRYLLQGVPAIVVLLLAAIQTVVAALPRRDWSSSIGSMRSALAHDEPSDAIVAYRRLLDLDPRDPETCFQFALACEQVGESQRAEELIDRLAPRNHTGYAPAHLRQAQRAMAVRPLSREAAEAAHSHLERALQLQPGSGPANAMMARLFLCATSRIARCHIWRWRPRLTRICNCRWPKFSPEKGKPTMPHVVRSSRPSTFARGGSRCGRPCGTHSLGRVSRARRRFFQCPTNPSRWPRAR